MTSRHVLSLILALAPTVALAEEAAAPASPPPAATAEAPADKPVWSVMATAREEWRGRFASGSTVADESDHTARLFFDGDARSPQEAVALHASLGLWWRFAESYKGDDGRSLSLYSPREAFHFDVYSVAADWRPGGVVHALSAGRMEAEHGMPGAFDGLSLTLRPTPGLELFAFGGRSVHFFEVNPSLFENWLASGGLSVRGDWWRVEADYRFMKEDVPTTPANDAQGNKGEPETRVQVLNHSYGLSGWLRYHETFNARVQVRGIDDKLQLIGAAVRAEWAEQQLGLDAKIDVQPATLGELNEFDNPFFLTLGESKPHLKARVDLFKVFATKSAGDYAIHLGGDVRQLIGADESAFNRNLLRGYAILSAQKIAGTGLFLSVTGEIDQFHNPVTTTEETILTAGGALGWDKKPVKAEVGSAYYGYKYVYFQSPEEHANVTELYADLKVNVVSWLALRARYSYEIFDRTVHTATVSITEAY